MQPPRGWKFQRWKSARFGTHILALNLYARVAQSVAHRTYEAVLPELCEGYQFESGHGHHFFPPPKVFKLVPEKRGGGEREQR